MSMSLRLLPVRTRDDFPPILETRSDFTQQIPGSCRRGWGDLDLLRTFKSRSQVYKAVPYHGLVPDTAHGLQILAKDRREKGVCVCVKTASRSPAASACRCVCAAPGFSSRSQQGLRGARQASQPQAPGPHSLS